MAQLGGTRDIHQVRGGSRSRGKGGLFWSKNFGRGNGPTLLKKSKSAEYLESEYLMGSQWSKQQPYPTNPNPERR
jgi:hypothetical protein